MAALPAISLLQPSIGQIAPHSTHPAAESLSQNGLGLSGQALRVDIAMARPGPGMAHPKESAMKIRKLVTWVEECLVEMDQDIHPPIRRALAAAVLKNPFAGHFNPDLTWLIDTGEALGALLVEKALAALGAPAQSYGKAAIVGEGGELEHAAALLHPKMGAPIRRALGGGAALIPSAKKRAGMGATIDVPLGHKDAAYVSSHFDAIEARITDAPMGDEIVVCLALAAAGRPLPRIGGLQLGDIAGRDGLR
jgi:hypothetical protein